MATGVESICRHDPTTRARWRARGRRGCCTWPARQSGCRSSSAQPAVAIVGSRRATDYGMEMARSLARGLAASGVTVAGSLSDGIAVAAQEGALRSRREDADGDRRRLGRACPARRRALYERLRERRAASWRSCHAASSARASNWCYTARERIVVGMAQLTIVVEADGGPIELLGARIAKALGRGVAAVPGRVTSPASRGTHALLKDGAG